MTTKGLVVIFRHGETPYSKKHWLTGRVNVPLTKPTGENQARDLGRKMAGIEFDAALSSPLPRAVNTTELALEASGSNEHLHKPDGTWDIELCDDIIEGDAGDFAGHASSEPMVMNYPHGYDIPLPNGESDKQIVERVHRFIENKIIPRMMRGEKVAVGAHAGVLAVFNVAAGLEPEPTEAIWPNRGKIPTATPVVYEFEDGKIVNRYRL